MNLHGCVALSESKHGNNNKNHGDPAKVWLPVIYLKALGIPWTKQMDTVSSLKSRTMTLSEVATWVLFESILNGFRMIFVTNASTTLVKKIRPQRRVTLYILIPIIGFIGGTNPCKGKRKRSLTGNPQETRPQYTIPWALAAAQPKIPSQVMGFM